MRAELFWFVIHRERNATSARCRAALARSLAAPQARDPRAPNPWLARMLLPHAASAVNATAAFPIFTLLAVGHASTGIDLLVRTERDEVPLILELLTERACPGSVLCMLQSQALGLIASSGVAVGDVVVVVRQR